MKKIILAGAIFFLFANNLFSQWFWQNPKPHGNDLLDIQSVTENIGFVCGKHGTFLKTTTGGVNWLLLHFPERVDLLRLNFISPTIGWVTGKKDTLVYLYKTTNAGNTWIEQLSAEADLISSYFICEAIGFLSLDSILFRTTDGGTTWIQLQVLDPITDIFFIDSAHGWVSGRNWSSDSKIYFTLDGGNTWQFSTLNNTVIKKIRFQNISNGWIISNNDFGLNSSSAFVWKTTNGGSTWQQQLEYGGVGYSYVFTDVDFINEFVGWVVSRQGTVFKTTNSGTSWDEVSNAWFLNYLTAISDSLLWGCGWYGVNYISGDGGINWQKNYTGELLYECTELFIMNAHTCFIGGRGALLKTLDGGVNWGKKELNVPGHSFANVRSIWFTDSLHGWLGSEYLGGNGGLLRTSDGGFTYTVQVDSIIRVFDIYYVNNLLGWFTSGSSIYHTSNGGNTWFVQAERPEMGEFMALQFTSTDVGWAGGYIGLFKTTDGGYNWTQVFPAGINPYTVGIYFLNSLEGWVISQGGLSGPCIFKTSDGGISWENQSPLSTINSRYSDIFFKDANNGWVVGRDQSSNALFLRTTNGGSNWKETDLPTSHTLYKIGFANDEIGWVLSENGSVLHTTNGGTTFIKNENSISQPNSFFLEQNYPNPFNPTTKITYQIPNTGFVQLKIYDVLGKEIATLVNEEKLAGNHVVEFRTDDLHLSSGIYFYSMRAGDFAETKKMILLR